MIIDSHCHLTYEPMSNSLNETIDRANQDGVKYILTISTEDKSYNKIINIITIFLVTERKKVLVQVVRRELKINIIIILRLSIHHEFNSR